MRCLCVARRSVTHAHAATTYACALCRRKQCVCWFVRVGVRGGVSTRRRHDLRPCGQTPCMPGHGHMIHARARAVHSQAWTMQYCEHGSAGLWFCLSYQRKRCSAKSGERVGAHPHQQQHVVGCRRCHDVVATAVFPNMLFCHAIFLHILP